MNVDIMNAAGFKQEVQAAKEGKCPFCGVVIDTRNFKNDLSRREYKISGLCQKCQDDYFV
jgi:hypothetical protein